METNAIPTPGPSRPGGLGGSCTDALWITGVTEFEVASAWAGETRLRAWRRLNRSNTHGIDRDCEACLLEGRRRQLRLAHRHA